MMNLFNIKTRHAPTHDEEKEYTQYTIEVERTLTNLEAQLHTIDDPEEIAKMALKTAC